MNKNDYIIIKRKWDLSLYLYIWQKNRLNRKDFQLLETKMLAFKNLHSYLQLKGLTVKKMPYRKKKRY